MKAKVIIMLTILFSFMFTSLSFAMPQHTISCPRCGYIAEFTSNIESDINGQFYVYKCAQGHRFLVKDNY